MAWEVAKPTADGMMARMPELSRRAILRLSVGAAAGAAGAYALGTALHAPNASVAGPQLSMTSAGAPLAPPPPLEPRVCATACSTRWWVVLPADRMATIADN